MSPRYKLISQSVTVSLGYWQETENSWIQNNNLEYSGTTRSLCVILGHIGNCKWPCYTPWDCVTLRLGYWPLLCRQRQACSLWGRYIDSTQGSSLLWQMVLGKIRESLTFLAYPERRSIGHSGSVVNSPFPSEKNPVMRQQIIQVVSFPVILTEFNSFVKFPVMDN